MRLVIKERAYLIFGLGMAVAMLVMNTIDLEWGIAIVIALCIALFFVILWENIRRRRAKE
jgi:membrane protein implicated in regulation of membrane protease activity